MKEPVAETTKTEVKGEPNSGDGKEEGKEDGQAPPDLKSDTKP